MSLVIEALRRVEKTDARAGSIGAAVASYRPTPKPRRSVIPLLLGLLAGGAMVFVFGSQGKEADGVSARSGDDPSSAAPQTRRLKGAAGLPPPLIIEPARSNEPGALSGPAPRGAPAPPNPESRRAPSSGVAATMPGLVLQAISERDSQPIAIINDQLVKEGDRLGRVRVLRIGSDSVDVLLENGRSDTVRFAPPPPPSPEASPSLLPSPSPDPRP